MPNACERRPSTRTSLRRAACGALLLSLVAGASLSGCRNSACSSYLNISTKPKAGAPVKGTTSYPSHDVFAEIYQRTLRSFATAAFFRPSDLSIAGVRGDLAPLIVIEASVDRHSRVIFPRFGAIEPSGDKGFTIDTARPTVYSDTGSIEIAGAAFQTATYMWFHEDRADSSGCMGASAIRAVLGDDGFPLFWEVGRCTTEPGSRVGPRQLFVSSSLELEAEDRFGPPLTKRRHAIERDAGGTADAVVARIIEDGPIPMGPYVYIDRAAHRITTLLCRCSPSQMEDVVTTETYDLQPLADVREILASINRARDRSEALGIQFATSPETLIRWPRSPAPRETNNASSNNAPSPSHSAPRSP